MTSSKSTTPQDCCGGRPSQRIPLELQEVFIASAQGKEIVKPPPCGSRIFQRFFRSAVTNANADGKKKRMASFRLPARRSSITSRLSSSVTSTTSEASFRLPSRRLSMTSRLSSSVTSTTSEDTSAESEVHSNVSTRTWEVAEVSPKQCCALDEKCQTLLVQPEVRLSKTPTPTPQAALKFELLKRGYGSSTDEFSSLNTAYHNQPTKLQVASYGVRLLDSARNGDTDTLRALLHAGLSPNACNPQGESIVHDVCRRGLVDSLRVLMEFGCDVRIADSNGRTPMHCACWAAHLNFDMVELLMQAELNLFFISDASGKLPLSYVSKDREPAWLNFLMSKMDQYWPTCDGMETENNKSDDGAASALPPPPPSIASQQPGTRPVVDPTNALPIQLASMVADGRIEPDEAELLKYDIVESRDSDWDSDGTNGSNSKRIKASNESIASFNEASMADLLGNLDFCSEEVDWDW